jgi:6-phosphofructokinase 1
MGARDVGNIIHIGGTILKTARCLEFKTPEGTRQAYENLSSYGIDALVAIGGDGTATGANRLSNAFGIPVMCIPGTYLGLRHCY